MTKSCGGGKNEVYRILQKADTTRLEFNEKTFRECYRTRF